MTDFTCFCPFCGTKCCTPKDFSNHVSECSKTAQKLYVKEMKDKELKAIEELTYEIKKVVDTFNRKSSYYKVSSEVSTVIDNKNMVFIPGLEMWIENG